MEGLAAAGSVLTILQVTEEIGKLCGRYIHDVRHARKDIERLQSKVSALHKVLTRLENASHPDIDATAVQRCCEDLRSIKGRLEPKRMHALKWPFKSKELRIQVRTLERHLVLFNTTLQLNIHEKIDDAEQERLLEKLACAGDALFNSYENDRRHRSCLENTRVDVLQQIMEWSTDVSPRCIFWLKGLAGTGKSTIATTVASRLASRPHHIASYFFRRGHGDLAHVRKLIPTIVRQLSQYSSLYRQFVSAAVKKEPGLGQSANLHEQYEKLLVEPLRKIRPAQHPFFIVMDALDECDEQRDLRMLLRLLARTEDIPKLGLKIFVTSRPELPIRHGFEEIPSIFHRSLALQNVPRPVVDGDIKIFLSHKLKITQYEFCLPNDWPADEDLDILARKAGGLFIFAATACRYIGESPQAKPPERLKQICNSVATNELMTEELDHMYAMVLQNSISGKYTAEERHSARVRFHHIIGCIVLLLDPLPIAQLFSLVQSSHVESQQELEGVLQTLHAVIDLPEDAEKPVQPLHLSFRDFLLDPNRCSDPYFWHSFGGSKIRLPILGGPCPKKEYGGQRPRLYSHLPATAFLALGGVYELNGKDF
ncbi:MAG: hypothetical protein LQ338_007532 [Usnochroma carphineum]|nr:MAG: hypothetical protein LQ338_007532 [Usnochroma carphineum]